MSRTCFIILPLLMACALARPARAQQALVLSGGGGRGLAHAGVLDALEQRGYDPDLVVGTSMGAVVGALYAAGYEPSEIRDQLLAVNWRGMFLPTPIVVGPSRVIRYPMFSVGLDVSRLRASRGFLGQWRINRALEQMLFDANARARGDFNRLPRKYRAVAADLKTGAAVILERGDLALAARASMAVPGFFPPVHWGDSVLVDGGIADNLPTGVARRLGAQQVIASDVSRPSAKIRSEAPFAVIGRALDLMEANTQRDTVKPDVLVLPAIDPNATAATFPDDPTTLIESGLQAGLRALPPVRTVAGGKRAMPPAPDSFARIVVEAPDSALAALARAVFRGIAPGKYDRAAISRAVDRLYMTGLLEGVWPSVEDRAGDALPSLIVRLDGPPKVSLSGAANYETDRGGRAWVSLDRYSALLHHPTVQTITGSLEGLSRWLSLSARVQSLSRVSVAWSLGTFARQNAVRSFESDVIRTNEVRHMGGWTSLELPLILRERSTALGVRAEWIDVEHGTSGYSLGPSLRWAAIESPGRVVGIPLALEAERRWGDFSYTRAAFSVSHIFHVRDLQLAPLADVQAVSSNAPPDLQPSLGDQHLIPGLQWGEQRARARAAVGLDIAHPVISGFLRLSARAGTAVASLEDARSSRWLGGVQAAIVWPTPLGAIDLGYGVTAKGDGRFDVSLGARF